MVYMKECLMKINLICITVRPNNTAHEYFVHMHIQPCSYYVFVVTYSSACMSQFLTVSVQVCTLLSQSLHDLIFNKGIWPLARNVICIHTYKHLFNEQYSDIVQ